jgi:hypothetical protein
VSPPQPSEPSEKENPFEALKRQLEYKQKLAEYEEKHRAWQAKVDQQVLKFKDDITSLLNQKADANNTDVWSAVLRADLFLNESDAAWRQPTHRYLVLITDGLHNTKSTPLPMKSGAKVLMVNGAASLGSLERLNPQRFEAIASAFQFIGATERAGGQ